MSEPTKAALFVSMLSIMGIFLILLGVRNENMACRARTCPGVLKARVMSGGCVCVLEPK